MKIEGAKQIVLGDKQGNYANGQKWTCISRMTGQSLSVYNEDNYADISAKVRINPSSYVTKPACDSAWELHRGGWTCFKHH